MKAAKGRKLEARGYRVTDPKDFLGLSDTEARLVELKVSLIERLKEIREANKVTQAELAKLLKSSQSRVAKIEAGASDVSLDLICRALFALGESPAAIEKIAMQAHRKHLRAASNRSRDLRLSARERAVLQLFAEGKSTKEIAGMLHVCVKTCMDPPAKSSSESTELRWQLQREQRQRTCIRLLCEGHSSEPWWYSNILSAHRSIGIPEGA